MGEDQRLFTADASLARIRLHLQPPARWVVDAYPCEDIVDHDDGSTSVTLAVTAERWVQRLLLRLGVDAAVVQEASFDGADLLGPAAARNVLARYQR